jgi:hypothetical protein
MISRMSIVRGAEGGLGVGLRVGSLMARMSINGCEVGDGCGMCPVDL